MRKFIAIKRKSLSLFQSYYIQLQSEVSSLTSPRYLVQEVPSKKKKLQEEKRKEKERKEQKKEAKRKEKERKEQEKEKERKEMENRRRRERDGKSLCGRKGKGRMRCGRKEERKEERMKEKKKEKKEDRESGIRSAPPSPDTFHSTKLGNNITPIKGIRLGKNTTPTSRDLTKLNQNPQANPPQRRSSLEVSSRANFIYTPRKAESPKYELQSNRTAIYKKAKTHGNSRSCSRFSMSQH